jgi:hypothetical protein
MEIAGSAVISLAVAALAAFFLFNNHRLIRHAIESFRDNFPRGGPPTPMHPSPAGDDALLRQRRERQRP